MTIIITSIAVGLALTFGLLTGVVFVPKSQYDKAMSLLKAGDIEKAIDIFDGCIWIDSRNQANFAKARLSLGQYNVYSAVEYMYLGKGEVYATYDSKGGTSVSPGFVDSEEITVTSERVGYTFCGWELISYVFSSDNHRLDLSLKAVWLMNNYTLTVSTNNFSAGGVSISGTSSYSKSIAYNDLVTIIASSYTGHEFIGWYDTVDDSLIASNRRYTFNMPGYSVHYQARFL